MCALSAWEERKSSHLSCVGDPLVVWQRRGGRTGRVAGQGLQVTECAAFLVALPRGIGARASGALVSGESSHVRWKPSRGLGRGFK